MSSFYGNAGISGSSGGGTSNLQNLVDGSATNSVRGIATAQNGSGYTIGEAAFAEGISTKASGTASHAEGQETTASLQFTHAEGYATTAGNACAHTEGSNTVATGRMAHAEGYHTIANHMAQHVFGKYNVADDSSVNSSYAGNYVEIVGNGTGDNTRSNARTLDWNGNEVLAGKLTVGTDPVNNMDVTTKQYVDNKTQSFIVHVSEGIEEINGGQRHYYILDQTAGAIITAYQQTQVILEYEFPSDTAFPGYTMQYLCSQLLFKYNESNELISFVLPTSLNNNTTFTATSSIDFPTYYQQVSL